MTARLLIALVLAAALSAAAPAARAQPGPGGPPAVGVVRVEKKAITETSEFVGRVQAVDRVDLTARVTAFVQERLFTEGTEVQAGDLLYRLERGPFEAAVQQQAAAVAQANALLQNANIQLARAQALLNTPAGQRSTVDDARANQLSQAAQLTARPGAASAGADQSRLHRDPRADRGQDRPDPDHRRQRGQPERRAARHDRQPGPDVCRVPGRRPRASSNCEKRYADRGGVQRHRGQAATARRHRPTARTARSTTSTPPSRRTPTRSCCAPSSPTRNGEPDRPGQVAEPHR